MRREDVLLRAQAAAEASMRDTCRIERATGQQARDYFSGTVTDEYALVYEGRCRWQQPQVQATESDVGEDFQLQQRQELQLPVAATQGLEVGDRVTALTSRDPDMAGRVFLVHGLAHKTDASSRRVTVTERTD